MIILIWASNFGNSQKKSLNKSTAGGILQLFLLTQLERIEDMIKNYKDIACPKLFFIFGNVFKKNDPKSQIPNMFFLNA